MGLFRRNKQTGLELPPLSEEAQALAGAVGHDSPWMTETGFDLHGFYAEMWDVELMPSVNALKGLGLSAAVFYEGANLSEQWESGERDTQTSSLVTAIQFTNMLDDAEYDDAGVASLHGTMRTKALGLALACDSVHGTTYLADLATDPLQFGVHSMEDA